MHGPIDNESYYAHETRIALLGNRKHINSLSTQFNLAHSKRKEPGIIYYVYVDWKRLRIVAKCVKQSSLCRVTE